MSVAIMRPDRAKFATEDLLGGTAEERARAAETYVSYCGRYEFRGGYGRPSSGTQPVSQPGRYRAGTPRRSCGESIDPEHATDIACGRATDRQPDLGSPRKVRAVGSLFTPPDCVEGPFSELRAEGSRKFITGVTSLIHLRDTWGRVRVHYAYSGNGWLLPLSG